MATSHVKKAYSLLVCNHYIINYCAGYAWVGGRVPSQFKAGIISACKIVLSATAEVVLGGLHTTLAAFLRRTIHIKPQLRQIIIGHLIWDHFAAKLDIGSCVEYDQTICCRTSGIKAMGVQNFG